MKSISKRNIPLVSAIVAILFPVLVFSLTITNSSQPIGSVGRPALSTTNLSLSGGQLFDIRYTAKDFPAPTETGYDANNYHVNNIWSGDLLSNSANTSGVLSTINWRAREVLETQDWNSGRRIFTSSGGTGIKFRWDSSDGGGGATNNLTEAGINALIDTDVTIGATVLKWVRGNHGDETINSGALRPRQFMRDSTVRGYSLGDIIHSGPVYVGAPNKSFNFTGYSSFRIAKVARVPVVYVGSNDGMLHAFRASNGAEVFAYVPKAVLGSLKSLTATTYVTNHKYLVDGTPTVGDVCFGTCSAANWRTILVGGLNSGGKAVYALNITDPVADVTDENSAKSKFLWEVSSADADFTDLGYTYSKPVIARLQDGTWVAIFGNGYGANKAVLYIVNAQTGARIQSITLETATDQGLSSPTVVDSNFDGYADLVYAGDLKGKVWKIDLSAASSSGGATVEFSGSPLVNVGQAITTAPRIVARIGGGFNVTFGTGKLLEDSDKTDANAHAMYTVFDVPTAPAGGYGTDQSGFDVHTVEKLQIDTTGDGTKDSFMRFIESTVETTGTWTGWKLVLPAGERVINDFIVRSGRVTFTTINPTVQYNQNWRFGVDFKTGEAPPTPYFDINNDGNIDAGDLIDHDDDTATAKVVPIGRDEALGTVSGPTAARIVDDLDVVYVTHSVDVVIDPNVNPFNDPGLPGGHFDVDNFKEMNTKACYLDSKGKEKKCHVHQYDDNYNVPGINLLSSVNNPDPNLGTTGLISTKLREIDNSLFGLCNKRVTLTIINPNPVMAVDPFTGAPVEAGRIKLMHGSVNIDVYAPAFNALPLADRTAKACDMTKLEISFTNINALRATEPSCAQNNATGPILNGNTSYRDGSLTLRATSAAGESDAGTVVFETSVYEHLKMEFFVGQPAGSVIGCGLNNEDLRQYKDPTLYGSAPASSGSSSSAVTVGGGGTGVGFSGVAGTGRGEELGTDLGQHNWREILK